MEPTSPVRQRLCSSTSMSASASYHHHHLLLQSRILPRLSIYICPLPPPTTTKPTSLVRRCIYSIMTSTSVTTSQIANACYANNDNRGEDRHVISINFDMASKCSQVPAIPQWWTTATKMKINTCELSTSGYLAMNIPVMGFEVSSVQTVSPHQHPFVFFCYPLFQYANVWTSQYFITLWCLCSWYRQLIVWVRTQE